MQEVIEHYGNALQSIFILVLLFSLIVTGIVDDNENRGIASIIGANLPVPRDVSPDFSVYEEQSKRTPPIIRKTAMETAMIGNYMITDFFFARDCDGNEAKICVRSIQKPSGECCMLDSIQGKDRIQFEQQGVYIITLMAIDTENRSAEYTGKIPVNKG